MPAKLVQKSLLNGTQEFEIVDDEIHIRIKRPFGKEGRERVVLATLSTDSRINQSSMEFHDRNGGASRLSLLLNRPNDAEFNAFVTVLRQKIKEEHEAAAGGGLAPQGAAHATQLHEEPPEFDDVGTAQAVPLPTVNAARVEEVIQMLESYLDTEELAPLLDALQALREEPESEPQLLKLIEVFRGLGPSQGAVLTYAPYLSTLLADQMFSD